MSQGGTPKIQGSERIEGSRRRLLLDLDSEEAVARCMLLLPLIQETWEFDKVLVWPSASKGTHMLIDLGLYLEKGDWPIPIPVLGLQAILGSDPVRAQLTVKEMLEGALLHECNLLYKPPKCRCGEGWQRIGEVGGTTCHCSPMEQGFGVAR